MKKTFTIQIKKTIVTSIEADTYEEACALAQEDIDNGDLSASFAKAEPEYLDLDAKEPEEEGKPVEDSENYYCIGAEGNLWILGNHGDFDAAEDTAKSLGVDVIWMFREQTAKDWYEKLKSVFPLEEKGWLLTTSDDPDGQYLYVQRDGAPGQIHIKAEDEGFVVDIWSANPQDDYSVASTSATYTELEIE